MVEIKEGVLLLNGREVKFPDPVERIIKSGSFTVVFCYPIYENKEQWYDAWEKNRGENVFVLNQFGEVVWRFPEPATGIADLTSFWIKLQEISNIADFFWVTTSDFAYLVSLKDFRVVKEINTYILK